jgi:L-ornithine N5-oxygenase
VRLPLLEHIYETLYLQRLRFGNTPADEEKHWPHRIMPYRLVTSVSESAVRQGGVRLEVEDKSALYFSEKAGGQERRETLDVDAVFVATGYHRDLHETLLKDARHLMPGGELADAKWRVQRNYKIDFTEKSVGADAGVWLQGCCESTHGVSSSCSHFCHFTLGMNEGLTKRQLSDTLLSVLATRGGEMVRSIFSTAPAKWDNGDVLGRYEARL